MPAPRFSLKQLLLSVLWISIGFGGIAFSFRGGSSPFTVASDNFWPADLWPLIRMAARVIGWTFVCIGFIALLTRARRTRVLIVALCGIVPGAIIGGMISRSVFPPGPTRSFYQANREGQAIEWLAMGIVSAASLAACAIVVQSNDSRSKKTAG